MIWYLLAAGPGAALSVAATVLIGGRGNTLYVSLIGGAFLGAMTIGTAGRGSYRSEANPDRRIELGRRERWILAAIGVVVVIAFGMLMTIPFHTES